MRANCKEVFPSIHQPEDSETFQNTRRPSTIQEQEHAISYTLFLFGISNKKLSLLSVSLAWQHQFSQIPSSTELIFQKYRRLISLKTLHCYGKYNIIQTLWRAVGSRKDSASNFLRWPQQSKPLKYVKVSDLGCCQGRSKNSQRYRDTTSPLFR